LRIRSAFDGRGTSERYFDAFGRLVGENSPGFNGQSVLAEYLYDSLGRVTKASLPHLPGDTSQGHVTKEYDGFGRLSVAHLPDGNSVNYFYLNRFNTNSAFGWFAPRLDEGVAPVTGVMVQKPRGNFDVVISNEHGKPVRSFQVANLVPLEQAGTEYAYGAFDQVRNTRGPTSYSYIVPDAIGRTKTLYDSVLGRQDYVYDGFDEVVEHTDANQQTNVFTYDGLGRRRELRDGQDALIARWQYDGTGPNELGRLVAEWRRGRPDVNPHQGNWIRYYYQDVPTSGMNRGLLARIEYGIAGLDYNSESGVRYATSFDYRQDVPWLVDTMHYPDVGEPGALKTFAVQHDYDLSSGTLQAVQPSGDLLSRKTKQISPAFGVRSRLEVLNRARGIAAPAALDAVRPRSHRRNARRAHCRAGPVDDPGKVIFDDAEPEAEGPELCISLAA
jgi:YD repeat-containing protein